MMAIIEQLYMPHFCVGQKWIAEDLIFGTFYGEAIEVWDGGRSGLVIITDNEDNVLDTFSGKAGRFQASGEWRPAE